MYCVSCFVEDFCLIQVMVNTQNVSARWASQVLYHFLHQKLFLFLFTSVS